MERRELLEIINKAKETKIPSLDLSNIGIEELPPEIGQLTHLTVLSLSQNQLTHVPKELGNLSNLTVLSLSENQLTSVPSKLGNLSSLTVLSLSQNQLKHVPKELGNLSNLTVLSLSENQLTSVPSKLGNLSSLTELFLDQNQLTSVPKELGNLSNLTVLSLSENQLTSVPSKLGNLPSLMKLFLDQNQLSSVPKELGGLSNLTVLFLSQNQLSSVPKELGGLSNLTVLSLSQNQLTHVPKELEGLSNLTMLYLDENQLVSIPKELGGLSSLTVLWLNQNQLISIPNELKNLSNLNYFDISGNSSLIFPFSELAQKGPQKTLAFLQKSINRKELVALIEKTKKSGKRSLNLSGRFIEEVPPEIGELVDLKWLSLSDNFLSDLPESLMNLSSLEIFDISGNVLTKFPEVITKMQGLKELDISGNKLTGTPDSWSGLSSLFLLYLDKNNLTKVSESLGELSDLRILSLANNKIMEIPEDLGRLKNLNWLSLAHNRLTDLPGCLCGLTGLGVLDLHSNKLTNIPKELGNLSDLKELYLSHNQLTSVPKELGNLSKLTRLDLYQNPNLSFPPSEVVRQGLQATLTFLREQSGPGIRQWISKLLVVGEGGVGKTCLLRSLKNLPFEIQQTTTHGIQIQPLNLAHPTEAQVTMTLNCWDFGGQEIYHATHQFFLTNRSLFLLAWNARQGHEQGKLIYWLKTIRANAPNSPIILVATWTDERDGDLPLAELQQQFPQIIGSYAVSNKTGTGIKTLHQAIAQAAANLPLMGELWPETWLKFATLTRRSQHNHTTPQIYWQVMAKCGVSLEGRPVLAQWLHELGDILFFKDNPNLNNLVILKPQWVTEYISKVLEAQAVIDKQGIFTRQCMDELWSDLTPGLRGHFLELMEQFDLSYKIPDDPEDKSLVVERLDHEPPHYQALWDQKQREPHCTEISMKYQLSEILAGIPTWFIARQHRFTLGLHWRTGVLFGDDRHSPRHLALLRVERDTLSNADFVRLTVRGPMPQDFFAVLKSGLELTLRRYPGLQVTRRLPCPDPKEVCCTAEFKYEDLVRKFHKKKHTTECQGCDADVAIETLLFGLDERTQDLVMAKLEQIDRNLDQGFRELRSLVQRQFLQEFHREQKYLESYCPNLFVLLPDDRRFWHKDLGQTRINLQLYCQYPGEVHPTSDPGNPPTKKDPRQGFYPIDNPQLWLQMMAPYIRRMMRVLKYATPLVSPALGVATTELKIQMEQEMELMTALAKQLPDQFPDYHAGERRSLSSQDEERRTLEVEGFRLRNLRQFLQQQDPGQCWGGLRRVLTPEGDYLWLCEKHAKVIYPK